MREDGRGSAEPTWLISRVFSGRDIPGASRVGRCKLNLAFLSLPNPRLQPDFFKYSSDSKILSIRMNLLYHLSSGGDVNVCRDVMLKIKIYEYNRNLTLKVHKIETSPTEFFAR